MEPQNEIETEVEATTFMCGVIGSTEESIDYYVKNIKRKIKALVGDEKVEAFAWHYDAENLQQHQISTAPLRAADVAERFIDAGATCIAVVDDWMRGVLTKVAHVIGEDHVISLADAVAGVCEEAQLQRVALYGTTTSLTGDNAFCHRMTELGYDLVTLSPESQKTLDVIMASDVSDKDLFNLNRKWFQEILLELMKGEPIDALVFTQPRLSAVVTALNGKKEQHYRHNGGREFIYIDAVDVHIEAIANACINRASIEEPTPD